MTSFIKFKISFNILYYMKNLIWFLLFSLFSITINGQNMEKHQWENRVLLIFADDVNNDLFQNQLKALISKERDLKERKLIIYKFTKSKFSTDFNSNWESSTKLFEKYINKKDAFKILLIGLDGGIKLEQTKVLSAEKLFAIIDGMPMRKREIRNK